MKDNEKGAIIVEATIALPVFMFAIVTLLTIVNICFAQSKIGVAVNTTAKEISQYSYLYGLTGLNQKQAAMYEEGQYAKNNIDETLNGVEGLFSAASGIGGAVNEAVSDPSQIQTAYGKITEEYENGSSSVQNIQNQIAAISSDPKAFILGSAKLFGSNAIDWVKSKAIAEPLAKVFVKKHLVDTEGGDCEAFLKHLGVVPKNGSYFNGLDFGDSVVFLNGSDEIRIIVNYDIQVIKLLNLDIKLSFTQCGATKAWFSGVSTGTAGGEESEGEGETQNEEETSEEEPDYLAEGTKNHRSSQAMIGSGQAATYEGTSIQTARDLEMTYYQLDTDVWNSLSAEKKSEIQMSYLKNQITLGKDIYMVEDPYYASGDFKKQVEWLQSNGYEFEFSAGMSVWKAVKK